MVNNDIGESFDVFVEALGEEPCEAAIILGSGLGEMTAEVERARVVDYREIPGLPQTTVPGHCGQLFLGEFAGTRVVVFKGRFHLYEGHTAYQATALVRLAKALGCDRLLLSCAAGGIRDGSKPGDIMFVTDHLNFTGDNPLRGLDGDPFLDLSRLYEQALVSPLEDFAKQECIPLKAGILAALLGPSYETPAEIRMLSLLGADAVSMSTVPEAIMAKFLGMRVAAFAFISNVAAGLSGAALDHRDVLDKASRGSCQLTSLVRKTLELWLEAK